MVRVPFVQCLIITPYSKINPLILTEYLNSTDVSSPLFLLILAWKSTSRRTRRRIPWSTLPTRRTTPGWRRASATSCKYEEEEEERVRGARRGRRKIKIKIREKDASRAVTHPSSNGKIGPHMRRNEMRVYRVVAKKLLLNICCIISWLETCYFNVNKRFSMTTCITL